MALSKLGRYIALSDARNADNIYDGNSVVGLSTQKQIIKTKADLEGVNLTSYKLFPPKCFAYVPDTSRRGDKVSLAYNMSDETYIVSSISVVFYVSDLKSLVPDYLFMYFNRPEFDRYARFNSWGSAREAFSWDDMCDIDIELPDIKVQQKYVDIYNAMLDNQRVYESGLEDMRLICDAYYDAMKEDKSIAVSIGSLIERNDNRNERNLFGEKSVRGISNAKEFVQTKADVSGTDLSKFIVVGKNEFAYNSRTDGRDMLVLAINRDDDSVIVTWNYNSFRIKPEKAEHVNPEYLYSCLKRSEFDRLVRFMSWGSSQELFSYESLCEVVIPLPPIETQSAIAKINSVYVQRKAINERLKTQIKELCPILIKGSLEEGRQV
ncbi:MAG: restriction endonuclease subunit S [Oscillospiraceae bacterium]|nr:restriction endonuclease subunit S [Oscillospiraceae bacterium]